MSEVEERLREAQRSRRAGHAHHGAPPPTTQKEELIKIATHSCEAGPPPVLDGGRGASPGKWFCSWKAVRKVITKHYVSVTELGGLDGLELCFMEARQFLG